MLSCSFVCNFLSSSAGFNLCSCFFPAHLFPFRSTFRFRFPSFSRPSVPRFYPLPFRFLTPAVFAFFRPLQFWVLTTQPLFFFSAFFSVPPPSGFPVAPSLLSLLRFFPLSFRLISHPVCPILLTQLCCSFPFALPCFAPTAVPQVLAFFPVSFVPLFPASVLLRFAFFPRRKLLI